MSKAMNTCERLKEILVTTGRNGIEQDTSLAEHLRECEECQRVLQAWTRIPGLLHQLPEHEPEEALVRKTSQSLAKTGHNAVSGRYRFIAPSLASATILLAAIGLSRELLLHQAPKAPVTMETRGVLGQSMGGPDNRFPADSIGEAQLPIEQKNAIDNPLPVERDRPEESRDYRGGQAPVFAEQQKARENEAFDRTALTGARSGDDKPESAVILADEVLSGGKEAASTAEGRTNTARHAESPSVSKRKPDTSPEQLRHDQPASMADPEDADDLKTSSDKNRRQRAGGEQAEVQAQVESPSDAFDFLGYYQKTDDLQFQPANGYWANTYIPGDPEIRWLSARLAQWDRSWLQSHGDLEKTVTPVEQPFDAPDDNALSLSLMADANAIMPAGFEPKPTRMRLQVGIRGIAHRHGQRPAMNVGVVIDLPADAPDAVRIAGRALLDAMLQSKQAGDQFSLVVTGQPGVIVEADDFRFGPLQLARQLILGQDAPLPQTDGAGLDSSDSVRSNIDLYEAIERAGAMVRKNDDPSRPLGSSAVLLISAREIDKLDGLLALAHRHAKAGITLSVFPLGEHALREQADQLALAGLGNQRFLEAPNQARQLIEEELHASSRAVARAARLSVRLAPGVKLIGVVGSERLDTEQAQQVRDIENSMDRRLSANLGIQADRGVDEEGIQILIPTIYAGDNVTVLLDVVTDRPGAVADVSLRYKDLVFLRNGNLQNHLELPEGELERGPAELAVLKNLLSHHFVIAVSQAAAALARQQANQAAGILRAMRATIENVRQTVPGWNQDPDLIHDQQVLDQYISALTSPEAGAYLSFLTESLQYAAWAKTHRGLEEWK